MVEVNVIPCRFTAKQVAECSELGFLTWPQFVDNLYTKENRCELSRFFRDLERFGNQVKYAVCPDAKPLLSLALRGEWDEIQWIYPLHQFSELTTALGFRFVGFPHREHFRNYTLEAYLGAVPYEKRWYLGFWNEKHPEILLNFYGMDTTIPETYSGKFGCIWHSWRQFEKPKAQMKNNDILKINLRNLALALKELHIRRPLTLEAQK